jgi:glycosyltransferase involved in cell wall biosynthesis
LTYNVLVQIPILFYSDSPELPTGLARIARDLACLVAGDLPQYRVGYYGRNGHGSRDFPFAQYTFQACAEDQWGLRDLEPCWNDFAGNEDGIIFTIQDPSRMYWFGVPATLDESPLRAFLTSKRFRRWGYWPVDATGPGDRLTGGSAATVAGYDRVLAYTKFGARVLSNSIGQPVDWIPHGLDMNTFQHQDPKAMRMLAGFADDAFVIGVNMTNQPRKDWGLVATVAAKLKRKSRRYRMWWHTDAMVRAWSIPALLEDFQIEDIVKVTFAGNLTDQEMAYHYSGCDATMLPSLGEGFGFPIVESQACGVPCLHGDYGGGAEFTPWRVLVQSWRLDTPYNCLRPVYNPDDWFSEIVSLAEDRHNGERGKDRIQDVQHLAWSNLWPACWRKWFVEGA